MNLAATPTAPTSAASRFAAGAAFAGSAASLLVLAALHITRSDLSPGGHMISEYAIGHAPLGLSFFALQAVGALGMAAALPARASGLAVRIGIALLVLAAVGLGLAVAFTMDPLTTPPGQETMSGTMHGVAALVGIPTLIAATLVLGYALPKHQTWQRVGPWLKVLGHLSWIALALMIACMLLLITQGMTAMGDLVGWANRLLVLAFALWLMVASWPLLKSGH